MDAIYKKITPQKRKVIVFQFKIEEDSDGPTTKCRLTMGSLPVKMGYRHLKGGSDPGVGSRPAHRS
jgi:hypothetical protein